MLPVRWIMSLVAAILTLFGGHKEAAKSPALAAAPVAAPVQPLILPAPTILPAASVPAAFTVPLTDPATIASRIDAARSVWTYRKSDAGRVHAAPAGLETIRIRCAAEPGPRPLPPTWSN